MNEFSDMKQPDDDRAAGLEREVRALRDVFERIYSLMWWCAVLFFSVAFNLSVWAITGNLGIAMEWDLILVAAYAVYQFVKWLFADVTWSQLKNQIEFAGAAECESSPAQPVPSSVSPAGT